MMQLMNVGQERDVRGWVIGSVHGTKPEAQLRVIVKMRKNNIRSIDEEEQQKHN